MKHLSFIDGNAIIVFLIAEASYALGTAISAHQVYKNRKVLQNYSFSGACFALTGSIACKVAYLITNQIASAILGIPTIIYWGAIAIYKLKHRNEWGYSK